MERMLGAHFALAREAVGGDLAMDTAILWLSLAAHAVVTRRPPQLEFGDV